MDIFQHNCEVTLRNTNQTHVGTWELLVKTVPPSVPSPRKYSYDVIVVGKYNCGRFIFLHQNSLLYAFDQHQIYFFEPINKAIERPGMTSLKQENRSRCLTP